MRDWLAGAGVRLVIQDVQRAVPDLQEIDVSGRDALCGPVMHHQLNAVLGLQFCDVKSGPIGISIADVTLSLAGIKR